MDAYYITVENRIIPSGTLSAALNGVVVAPAVTQAIIDNGNSLDPQVVATGQTAVSLFTNGVNTHTRGVDFTLRYASDLNRLGHVDWSIGADYNSTSAYDIRSGSTQLNGQPLFDQTAISYLTTAAPRYKVDLGALWTVGRLAINLREVIYGQTSEYSQDGGLTDRLENIVPAHVIYYQDAIGVTPVTNINLSYDVLREHEAERGCGKSIQPVSKQNKPGAADALQQPGGALQLRRRAVPKFLTDWNRRRLLLPECQLYLLMRPGGVAPGSYVGFALLCRCKRPYTRAWELDASSSSGQNSRYASSMVAGPVGRGGHARQRRRGPLPNRCASPPSATNHLGRFLG